MKLDQSEGTVKSKPDKTVELYYNYSNWSNTYRKDDQLRLPDELSPIKTEIETKPRPQDGRWTPQIEQTDLKMSERRQEFSATFNNALSSVKKEFESQQSNVQKSIPNFYPNLLLGETESSNYDIHFLPQKRHEAIVPKLDLFRLK